MLNGLKRHVWDVRLVPPKVTQCTDRESMNVSEACGHRHAPQAGEGQQFSSPLTWPALLVVMT